MGRARKITVTLYRAEARALLALVEQAETPYTPTGVALFNAARALREALGHAR